MPGSLSHLAQRFFDVLRARPLNLGEVNAVELWLAPSLQELFFAQRDVDQRHGFELAQNVIAVGFESEDFVIAALVHDVGKQHANLEIAGRKMASLLILLRVPSTCRFTAYRDHGAVVVAELAEREPLVVDFALYHHGERPESIDKRSWAVLVAADQPPNTLFRADRGISSRRP